jgi:hypothetical protein
MDAMKKGVDGDAIRQDGSRPQACSIQSGVLDGALEVQPNGRERTELSCSSGQSAAARSLLLPAELSFSSSFLATSSFLAQLGQFQEESCLSEIIY